ncbi:phosphoenolpyruvate--protein phosphotransferase [Bacillus cereus]|uniref:phosphoenolpyruvate--protein phosphotransferase n=1 Tax=Bacillus cereus TaxID=1396 RepID=UPI0013E30D24|nr:phosphoenolpyruvate--protein phosphotransferase [Bacillus cereus]
MKVTLQYVRTKLRRGTAINYFNCTILAEGIAIGHTIGLDDLKVNNLDKADYILVADDLSPIDTISVPFHKIKGLILKFAGPTSHAVILAKSLGIPVLLSSRIIDMKYKDIILDAFSGACIINPNKSSLIKAHEKEKKYKEEQKKIKENTVGIQKTFDNQSIKVMANVGSLKELDELDFNYIDGIGVFRTEFLFINHPTPPTEESHCLIYADVAKRLAGKPLIIRTFDIGGDKCTKFMNHPYEENPFLGYRAIRMLDTKRGQEIFKDQIKGALRASIYGNISIMVPMISHVEQLRFVKNLFEECKKELEQNGILYNHVELGIMIEIPSSCLIADQLATEADFFSIGTNDLTQYTLAVDRQNSYINNLYQEMHPSIIKLMKMVADAALKNNKWVGICGELASNTLALPILIGLGINELSMNPYSTPTIKSMINNMSYKECKIILNTLLNYATIEEIHTYLNDYTVRKENILVN